MATRTQDHIHLGLTLGADNAPAQTFHIRFPAWDNTPLIPASTERGITGSLFVHRLVDGSGNPKRITEDALTLLCTRSEKDVIRNTLAGNMLYYVPLYHPDSGEDHAAYRQEVFMTIRRSGIALVDPVLNYWSVTINLSQGAIAQTQHSLAMHTTVGTGAGIVVASIQLGEITSYSPLQYRHNTVLSLLGCPETGSQFGAWSGDDVPSGHELDNPLALTMNANKDITAIFMVNP